MQHAFRLLVAGAVLPLVLPSAANCQNGAALPPEWDKYSPVFRGPESSGMFRHAAPPTEWNEGARKGILWKIKVPLPGLSSPVVWGDKVFISGATRERREVYCFSTADGKLLWTGTYKSDPNASVDYQVYDTPESLMHAAPTPAVDGKRVYAMFANGELAAFDAASGKSLWSRLLGNTEDNTYGLTASLLVYKDSVIAQFDGDKTLITRLDGATGKEVWKSEREDKTWASPILVKLSNGRYIVVTSGDPVTSGWDVETGEKLWSHKLLSGDTATSPIHGGGLVYVNSAGCGIFALNSQGGSNVVWSVDELQGGFPEAVSMTTDGTNLWQFHGDALTCLDARTGAIVFETTCDESASYASPFVAGGRLYLVCGQATLIVEPGKEFKQLGVCQIDEYSDVSPAVAGTRIYMRTEESLYCIGR